MYSVLSDTMLFLQPFSILGGQIEEFVQLLGLPEAWGGPAEAITVLLLITVVVYALGRMVVMPAIDRIMDRKSVDLHLQLTLLKGVHILVVAGAIGLGFYISGYTFLLGAVIAGLAAGGLSIGIAMQGAVRNVVAGLFIHAEKPFRIGDEIEWDDNFGIVEDINLRVTRVRSFDNKLVTVPNSKLTDGITKNPVRDGPLRLEINFPVDLKADVAEVKEILLSEAKSHDKIIDNPAPAAYLMDFEESRLRVQARIWLANRDIGKRVRIRDEYATAVKLRLEEAGIDIPYPHRRLSKAADLNPTLSSGTPRDPPELDDGISS